MKKAAIIAAALALGVTAPALADHHMAAPGMSAVLAADARADDSARDQYRNPAETLSFFDVKPGMTVVDYMPSGGWYTRILVPYLGEGGTYIGMNPAIPADATGFMARMANYGDTLPGQVTEWLGGAPGAKVVGVNVGDEMPESMAGSVDRVLIFREIHNMHRFGWLQPSLASIRTMLKDDGMVGVVQHRAPHSASADYTDGSKGYMREADVIALFQANGFELYARSEVNANPADPANWPNGVWTLPPRLGGATDETRPALVEIGESDRMTLLFRKRP
ncbi:class I SAM-dependent methyltransferase [Paraurantiacibacter namhicola]|uniref:Methyltransferase n=1 Tax=Paraurantiacibacter namhicola TaxID=645517 RepID=A0A1C7D721_9SPHN|nr:class I SAM-dependent methyltransferase [Paraurantiacibacter namhicola]ANU07121.1 hypothetical protein A6F65_00803 [Paraurantiacibacter namhicola]